MAYNLVISARAEEQVDKLVGYLMNKLKNPGAALHFLDELEAVYNRLEENPYQFRESKDYYLSYKGYREALFRGMFYRVIFRVEKSEVLVVGVFHNLEDYGKKVEEN